MGKEECHFVNCSYQKLKKWSLILPCLTFGIIKYISRVKWRNLREGVAPSSTLRCSSYRKGSLWVALDYGRQLYLLYFIKSAEEIPPTF